MLGVPRELIEHELNIDPTPSSSSNTFDISPKIKIYIIKSEVARLLGAGFIKEAYHTDW
jgi:hypothetical protein